MSAKALGEGGSTPPRLGGPGLPQFMGVAGAVDVARAEYVPGVLGVAGLVGAAGIAGVAGVVGITGVVKGSSL